MDKATLVRLTELVRAAAGLPTQVKPEQLRAGEKALAGNPPPAPALSRVGTLPGGAEEV